MQLKSVYKVPDHVRVLHALLAERTPEQAISHKAMPSFEEHAAFIASHPYRTWNFILNDAADTVGAVYLTREREIGVFVFAQHRGHGYGRWAVEALMKRWPGRFLANVNPRNPVSRRLFESFGFVHVQDTLEYRP
jgi:RimJ/RimL family protein N-acetyltransferase